MQGIITEIQRFSLHDGAGIRTTVFFKGCNMRCAWCHNPETFQTEPQLARYPEKCIRCGHCDTYCATGARTIIGQRMASGEVMAEILRDKPYYEASLGGVTLSGGEPAMQADFAAEILRMCREEGIGTAIETNLSLPWERYEKMLPFLDAAYFDIKLADSAAHRQYTGIGNEEILRNARLLSVTGLPFTVRTPLIPGITDGEENIREIARFVSSLPGCLGYELLNYNPLAEPKWAPLGLTYSLPGLKTLPEARLQALRDTAEAAGAICGVRRG